MVEEPKKKDPEEEERVKEDRKKKVAVLKDKIKKAEIKQAIAKETNEEKKGEQLAKPKKSIKTMDSLSCFYIKYRGTSKEPLALEVSQKDKYAPKKTGVYNIDIQKMRVNKSDNSKNKLA